MDDESGLDVPSNMHTSNNALGTTKFFTLFPGEYLRISQQKTHHMISSLIKEHLLWLFQMHDYFKCLHNSAVQHHQNYFTLNLVPKSKLNNSVK